MHGIESMKEHIMSGWVCVQISIQHEDAMNNQIRHN